MALKILITGCSSGFGRLTSETLARRGHTVYAGMREPAGRNAAAAEGLRGLTIEGGGSVRPFEIDVASDASVDAGVAGVLDEAGHLDVVVNNAGIGLYGLCETFTPEQLAHGFNVNVGGIQRVNRATLPGMRARGVGLIVHISSSLGRIVIPGVGVYGATKFAVEGLVEAYRYELAPLGVEAVLVEPGGFPTEVLSKATQPADAARMATYGVTATMIGGLFAAMQQMLSPPHAPDPQMVADAVARLVDLPAGTRPARTVVDPNPQAVEGLNAAAAQVQGGLLGMLGLGAMLEVATREASS